MFLAFPGFLGLTFHVCAAAGAGALPGHQPGNAVVWQYPSEQMFYNAMKRKGWDAKEEDMPAIVAIHNGVNERAWHQVCQYEVRARSHCGPGASVWSSPFVARLLPLCARAACISCFLWSTLLTSSVSDRLFTAGALPG